MPKLSRRSVIGAGCSLLAVAIVAVRVHGAQGTLPSGLFSYEQLSVRWSANAGMPRAGTPLRIALSSAASSSAAMRGRMLVAKVPPVAADALSER